MIIPIRCYTCGFPWLASRWELYVKKVEEYRKAEGKTDMEYLTPTTTKTAEGKALDDVGLKRPCCRRHFLGHVDLM